MKPSFDIEDIKAMTDPATYEKAVNLYNKQKVIQFKKDLRGCSAKVISTEVYNVYVDLHQCNKGDCNCYLGKQDIFCKHMVAVAIYAVMNGKALSTKEQNIVKGPICSNKTYDMVKEDFDKIKKDISSAMKHIKVYSGGSKKWFAYQDSLSKGCYLLSNIISQLPVNKKSSEILINLLLKLDKKLSTGVDDSDGTVGSFMYEVVGILEQYAQINSECINAFKKLCDKKIAFDWKYPLIEILDKQ